MVAVANVKHLANLLAKHLVVLQTKNAKIAMVNKKIKSKAVLPLGKRLLFSKFTNGEKSDTSI